MDLHIHSPQRLYGILLSLGGGGVEWNRVHYYWDHYWPTVPAPDDGNDECGAVGGMEWNRVHYYWDHYWPTVPAPDDGL
jgi:hypothetical protein